MKKVLITTLTLVGILLLYVFYIFYSTGFFREIDNSFSGEVEKSISLPGVEDMQISYDDHFILLSSDDRASRRDGKWKQGHLYYIDLTDTSFEPVQLTSDLTIPFFPHGISMIRSAPNVYKVFVVNHPKNTHTIEVFDLIGDSLVHVKTMQNPSMISPNDVVAIDENRFYFTNDHGYTKGLGKMAEEYLGLSVSNAVYFDGENYSGVADDIAYANGINFDAERNMLFIASPRDFLIKVYQHTENGDLRFIENIPCATGVDNIEIGPDGKLWIGAHPSLLSFTAYASGSKPIAPSEIITIDYRNFGDYTIETIFLDDGERMSASTVATMYKDLIFTGNAMDDHFLILRRR